MEQQDIKRMAIALVVISALTFLYLWFVGSQVPQQTVQHTDTIQQTQTDTTISKPQESQTPTLQTQNTDTTTITDHVPTTHQEPNKRNKI